jgi:hypothetical protein
VRHGSCHSRILRVIPSQDVDATRSRRRRRTQEDDVKLKCALADWMDEDPDLDRTDPADRELMPFLVKEGVDRPWVRAIP